MGGEGPMTTALRVLHVLNVAFFVGIAWVGLQRFFAHTNPPSQLIALAVSIVGPLEDYLKTRVRRGTPTEEEPAVQVVDKATSAIFLALLLWVLVLLS
jgi:hypothetical protein